jgi:hypothetical protein
MYHSIKRRQNAGSVLTFDEGEESDSHMFLDRFELKKKHVFSCHSLLLFHWGPKLVYYSPETATVAFLENKMFSPSSSRRHAIPKGTSDKSPSTEPVPERRLTCKDPRKTGLTQALTEVDDESASHTPGRCSVIELVQDLGSDDPLALTPSVERSSSRYHAVSLSPRFLHDDDDELDELDWL